MNRLNRSWIYLFGGALLWSCAALAQTPEETPTEQEIPAELAETPEIQFSTEKAALLREKAAELATPVAIYEYLRNNHEYLLYHGSRSGSINTFLGQRGNDVDLASTLIAMLRAQQIPARYVVGNIKLATARLENWLQVRNPQLAIALLRDQGIQGPGGRGARFVDRRQTFVEFEHVWVEALVRFHDYRGAAVTAPCSEEDASCRWVALDPSFKQHDMPQDPINITDQLDFDYDAYYKAIRNNDQERLNKNPLTIYKEQILTHLRAHHPGKTLEDVKDRGPIIQLADGLLPASLPYTLVGTPRRYASVAAHDATIDSDEETTASQETKPWSKYLEITLNIGGVIITDGVRVLLTDAATKRLTLTYELGSTERLVIRLDGEDYGTPLTIGSLAINDVPVSLHYPFSLTIELDGPPAIEEGEEDTVITTNYDNLIIGGYYLIGVGGYLSNYSQVHRAAEELLAANEQYSILNNAAGTPYVDANKNGLIDEDESTLLNQYDAYNALAGGLLYTAMSQYLANVYENIREADALYHTHSAISGFIGITSSTYEVEYLADTAFSVMPGGLLIDVKGLVFSGVWENDQAEKYNAEIFSLLGHGESSLEHEIWQELTGYDAISTVRGIQKALAQDLDADENYDAELLTLRRKGEENTLDLAAYRALGFDNQAPSPFVLHNRSLFTTRPSSWSLSRGDDQSFVTFKAAINDQDSDLLQRDDLHYASDNGIDDFLAAVSSVRDEVQTWPSTGGTLVLSGEEYEGSRDQLLGHLRDFYLDNFNNSTTLQYLDRAQGFSPSDQVYRNHSVPADYQEWEHIHDIRDLLYLSNRDGLWLEYLMPSRLTVGEQYRFAVYLRSAYIQEAGQEAQLFQQSFTIQNQYLSAGGGYVDGTEQLTPESGSLLYDSEIFNSETLNSLINNDLVRTPSTIDPVSTVTGNMYHDETDITIKGRGLHYNLTRTYNSKKSRPQDPDGDFGRGWSHAYAMRLMANDFGATPDSPDPENNNLTTSSITYTDERGGDTNYLVDDGQTPSWAVSTPTGLFDTLSLNQPEAGYHTLSFRNGVNYTFYSGNNMRTPGQSARLHRIEDADGNQLMFNYDDDGRLSTISDNLGIAGRTGLNLSHDDNGHITQITDFTQRSWRYTYDEAGRLSSVSNPLGHTTRYTYAGDSHLLETITLPGNYQGQPVATTFDYYQNQRAFRYHNSLGETETLDYDLYRRSTRVTDPRGFVRVHHYDSHGALIKLEEPDGGILQYRNTQDGLRYQKYNALGHATHYSYQQDRRITDAASDNHGRISKEQDALGHTIEYDYGPHDQISRLQDKNGHKRYTTYYTQTNTDTGAFAGKPEKNQIEINGERITLSHASYTQHGQLKTLTEYLSHATTEPGDDTDNSEDNTDNSEDDTTDNTARTRTTTYTYDANGFLPIQRRITGSDTDMVQTVTYTHDALGRRTSKTLKRRTSATDDTLIDITTHYQYDNLDRLIKITNPAGHIHETRYDANGHITQEKIHYPQADGSHITRTYASHEYDAAGRRIATTDIDGHTTSYRYNKTGQRIETTNPLGHTLTHEYDAQGRISAIRDGNGYQLKQHYDLAGKLIALIHADGHATTHQYDALGRRTQTTSPLGHTTRYQYNAMGQTTALTDAEGHTTTLEYDAFGRTTQTTNPLGGINQYQYDLMGNLIALTDPKDQTTRYTYNSLGQHIETIDPLIQTPDDKTLSYRYDEQGNRIEQTDRAGHITRYTYDTLGRLSQIDALGDENNPDDDQQTRYTYNRFGDLITLNNQDISTHYQYDTQHRLTQKQDTRNTDNADNADNTGETSLNKTLNWQYNPAGQLTQKTDYQGHTTQYQYDATGRLTALQHPEYIHITYHYDARGRLQDRIGSNGLRSHYQYDADSRLRTLDQHGPTGQLWQQDYQYNARGHITQTSLNQGEQTQGEQALSTSYTYDALGRLTEASNETDNHSYTYDAVGNRLRYHHNEQEISYHYNRGNQLLETRNINTDTDTETETLHHTYTYDDQGRRTEKRDANDTLLEDYHYNAQGRLQTLTQYNPHDPEDSHTTQYQYDPYGHRIQVEQDNTQQRYYLEGEHLEAIYDQDDAWLAHYLRGVVIDELVYGYQREDADHNETAYAYLHDHQQSVVLLADHAGETVQSTRYTPFGNIAAETGETPNRLKYTGREQDPSGLYYYRARYYDPEVGRFLTEDPLGFKAGINFYAYVNNNPVSFNDPSGNICVPCVTGIIGGTGGAITSVASGNDLFSVETGAAILSGAVVAASLGTPAASAATTSLRTTLSSIARVSPGSASALTATITGTTAAVTSDTISQGIEIGTGNQESFDLSRTATSTLAGLSSSILPAAIAGTAVAQAAFNIAEAIYVGAQATILTTLINRAVDSASNSTNATALSTGLNYSPIEPLNYSPTNTINNAASGGFVPYPSRTNTNMMQQQVYAK